MLQLIKLRLALSLVSLVLVLPLTSVFAQQPAELDPTFNPVDIGLNPGAGASLEALTSTIQPDGKIIIGGEFGLFNEAPHYLITRLTTNGRPDAGFTPDWVVSGGGYVATTSVQSDGKIIVGGRFSFVKGSQIYHNLVRLHSNGTIDTSFNIGAGLGSVYNSVNASVILPDGKIVIGGDFATYNGTSRNGIARLNINGTLDSTFNPGLGAINSWYNTGKVNSIALQPDGKIIIGGNFDTYNGTSISRIARLHPSGSLDTTFGTGTGFSTNSNIRSVALQADGKILAGGDFFMYNNAYYVGIIRLNTDGTTDNSFLLGAGAATSINGSAAASVYSVAVLPDGKIMLGGDFTYFNNVVKNRIVRLNTNGAIDPAFNPAGAGASGPVYSITPNGTSKLIIGGDFTLYNGKSRHRITRLFADGDLDVVFNHPTGVNYDVNAMVRQADGKLIIAGIFSEYNDTTRTAVARLHPDGTLDAGFENPGAGPNSAIFAVAVQSTGKVIVGGQFSSYNTPSRKAIVRHNSDGTLDAAFWPVLAVNNGTNPYIRTVLVQPDDKIIIGGLFDTCNGVPRKGIARLNADGTLDTSFNPGTGVLSASSPAYLLTSALLPNGQILVGGKFETYNGIPVQSIAKLNSDGSLVSGFNPGSSFWGAANASVNTLALQPDGKLVAGGYFSAVGAIGFTSIARFNTDGSVDTAFAANSNYTLPSFSEVYTLAIQADGRIVAGGYFGNVNLVNIIRYNADGTPDITFNPGTGADSFIRAMVLQPDGKIVIAGHFRKYNGAGRNRIARLYGGIGTGLKAELLGIADVCPGEAINVPFTAEGNFGAGNTYIAQLSDSAGSFNSPTTIGTLAGTTSGTIASVIPHNLYSSYLYRIRVIATSPGTTSIGNGNQIYIKEQPSLTIALSDTVLCVGSEITLQASGAYLYTWASGNGLASGGTDMVNATPVSPGIATYSVTGDMNGCIASASVTVNVQPGITVTASGDASICQGQAATLSANGADWYSWSTGQTGDTISVYSYFTDTYTVTGTSAQGCHATATFQVVTNPLPQLQVVATPAVMCAGQSTSLQVFGADSYIWSSGQTNPVITVNPVANTIYLVKGITALGCTDSTEFMVSVSPAPTITASAQQLSICEGQSTTLSVSGADNYTWSNGQAGSAIVVSPTAATLYTVTGTTNGCSDTTIVSVTVNPLPAVAATASQSTICAGESIALSATGAANYLWSTGQTDSVITVTPAGTTFYGVTGTSAQGCTTSNSILITVNPLPVLSGFANISVCEGQAVALPVSGPAGATYSWIGPGGFSSADQNPVVGPLPGSGVYTVTGTVNGCSSMANVTVTAIPLPIVTITASADTIAPGGTVTLTFTEINPVPGTVYQWVGPGLNQAAGNIVVANPPGLGLLQYILTASNGNCSFADTVYIFVDVTLSVQDRALTSNIAVYPNPFSHSFKVNFTSVSSSTEVIITDVLGRKTFNKTYQTQTGETNLEIKPETQLPQGLYLLQIKQDNQTQTIRIVKQ